MIAKTSRKHVELDFSVIDELLTVTFCLGFEKASSIQFRLDLMGKYYSGFRNLQLNPSLGM